VWLKSQRLASQGGHFPPFLLMVCAEIAVGIATANSLRRSVNRQAVIFGLDRVGDNEFDLNKI
jgi:hypothetical protein